MPKYELPPASDGSEQWIELKDKDDITRKEIRAFRLSWDGADPMSFREQRTEGALAQCLSNWQIKARSGDLLPMPSKDAKDIIKVTGSIPASTWYAIEDVIYGPANDAKDMGYIGECLEPPKADEDESDPPKPSAA